MGHSFLSNALKFALVLGSLSLAACGGGGGVPAATPTPDPATPTPEPATPRPDLMVANVRGLPDQLIDGVPFTVEVTVRNQGQGDAGSFRTALYASEDVNINTNDTSIAESPSGTILRAGNSTTVRLSPSGGSLPSGLTPGQTYYLGVIVDPDNRVPEEDEDNNSDPDGGSRPGASFPQIIGGALSGAVREDATETQVTGRATVNRVSFVAQANAVGTYGTFNIETSGDWTYRLNNEDDDTNALAANQAATESFRLTTTDSGRATVTITITGANDAATFSGTRTGAVTEDATGNRATGNLTVTDVDGDNALKQQAAQTGSYGSLSVNHSTGTWTYTLTNSGDNDQARATQALAGGATATETFTILAADDTPTTLTITITGVNDAATIGGVMTGSITEGTASTTGTVTSTDVDGTDNAFRTEVSPNDGTTRTTGRGTYGTLTITSAGVWTYTLDNSAGGATDLLAGGATATDAFTIMAADGTSGTVTITITGVDDPSTLSGGFEGSVTEDSTTNATATGEITVADIDTTPLPTITAQTNTAGTYGSFTLGKKNPSNEADRVYSWTYTLDNTDEDTNALTAGATVEDEFTITTSDGVNAKVTITITGADDSSTIGGGLSGSVTEDDSANLTARGTATVTDGDSEATFTAQTDTAGSYGTFSVTTAGVWTYSLDNSPGDTRGDATNALKAGQTESETFPITTSDSKSVSVTITVNGANDAAVFGTTGLTGAISEDADPNTTTGTAQATDVDGEDNKFTAVTAPASVSGSYGSLTLTEDGAWTYSLDNSNATVNALGQGATLTDSLTIQAKDGTAGTITITITGANDAATFSGTRTGAVTEDATENKATGTITVTDVDGDNALKQQADQTGSYGSLSVNHSTGTWTYTLTNSGNNAQARATQALAGRETATETFTILAADDTRARLTITITGVNDAATFSGTQSGAVTEDATRNTATGTITVTDVDGDNALKQQADQTGSYGSLSVNHRTGTWTYTLTNSGDNAQARATQALAGGETVTDTFTLLAADDTRARLAITIRGVNDPATFSNTTGGAVTEDATENVVRGTVTVNDVDGDNTLRPLTAKLSYGDLVVNADGSWSYTLVNTRAATNRLRAGQIMREGFHPTASDGTRGPLVRIDITGADDDATIAGVMTGAITEDATQDEIEGTLTLTDPDTDPLPTITEETMTGSYGRLAIARKTSGTNDGQYNWTYRLDNSAGGATDLLDGTEDPKPSDSFTILAADGASATITITITGVNDAPGIVVTGSGGSLTEDATEDEIEGTLTLTDPDTTPLPTITEETMTGTYGRLAIARKTSGTNDGRYNWTYTLDSSDPNTAALRAGQSVTDTFTIMAEGGTSATVTITVNGADDPSSIGGNLAGAVTENDTTNNRASGTVTVSGTATITAKTETSAYGMFTLSTDRTWTYTLDNSFPATNALAGGATVLDAFTIAASDNSSATVIITITGADDPDLLVASVSGLPVQWKDGDSFTASASLRNQGTDDAGSFEVGLYASADRTLTTGDTRIGSASVSALAKEASTSVSLAVSGGFTTLGLTQGRTYYMGVIADTGNSVAETDEGNNDDHANRIPAAASLIASDSTAPSETIVADSSYSGRWGWRGPGVDGPRGVAVDPWGTAAPISSFDTSESRFTGPFSLTVGQREYLIGAIGALHAYSMGLDGSGVVVAVIDSHIDNRHSDLDDNFLKYYDASGTRVVANSGYDHHGTFVAGVIAAERNGEGMHGVAPGADLIGISFGSESGGRLTQSPSDLGTSITSAVKDGARIFNNSYGTATFTRGSRSILDFSSLRKSVADAIDKGAVFVWAAGNKYSDNTNLGDNNTSEHAKAAIKYPELAGGFINVVNLDWDSTNSVWTIANSTGSGADKGSQICGVTKDYCLAAPGTNIISTGVVVGNRNGRNVVGSGTSYAAPMVSGGLAILFQAFPYVETADIMRLLFETATDLGDEGVDSTYGRGMMNLAAALNPVGSASIPTTTSTATSTGIDVKASALLAEAPLHAAVASATADMVMLDDYDRAFMIGDVMNELAVSDIQPLSIASADAVFASVDTELAGLRDFGSPITQAAAKAGALTIIGDRLTLPSRSGTSEVVLNSIATEDSGLAEFRYVATQAEEGWKASQSLGVIVEEDQLFGNKGSGAYALASQATTLSLGTSGQRDISEGVTLFGGLGLSRTEVSAADQSLVSLSSQFTSASGVMGLRMRDLGAEDRGEFAIQLGQDRAILSGEGSISVPVGREEGGGILFDQVQFDNAALGLEPEMMVSYANEYAPDASYSLSAAGRGEETILSAQWQRTF